MLVILNVSYHGVRRQGCAHTVNETVSAARMTSLSPQRRAGFLLYTVLRSVSHSCRRVAASEICGLADVTTPPVTPPTCA
ncbi:hypothetical protein J6590_060387 [Homalodisca vitripennis]|nr:hypothetical protein J6590_060387 [Homalodisca vitripennis]